MYNTEMDRQHIFARPSWYGIVAQLNGFSFCENNDFTHIRYTHSDAIDVLALAAASVIAREPL